MSAVEDINQSVSLWWVLMFVLITIGLAAAGIIAVDGYLIAPIG